MCSIMHMSLGEKKLVLMLLSSLIIVVFFVPYVGSGFAACGKLFSSLFGLDYTVAMIASAAVIIGYTATGGFMAASVTDFIQSIIMTIALIAVVCFGLSTVDGLQTVSTYSTSLDGYISLLSTYDFDTASRVSYGGIITIISTMAWGLGYFGMPHILLRFMAIEDPKKLKLSRRVASVWVVFSLGIAVVLGGVEFVQAFLAYRENEEFIIALSGSFDVTIDDGVEKRVFKLNRSYYGLYVPKG